MRLIAQLAAAATLGVFALAAPALAAGGLWTWTLYEDRASLALANEIPDSTSLAAVLECVPGSGTARVSIFPAEGSRPPVVGELKTTDPVFVAFVRSGRLSIKTEKGSGQIFMGPDHRSKLARFSRLCGA